MSVARSRELSLAAVAVTLVVVLSAAIVFLSPPGDGLPHGSSLSRDAGGGGRVLTAGARLSIRPRSIRSRPCRRRRLRHAARRSAGARVGSGSARGAAFAAGGGTLLVTGCQGLVPQDLPPQAFDASSGVRLYRAGWPSSLTVGAPVISMAGGCGRPDLGERYVPVYGDDQTDVVWLGRIGKGRAIWWADSIPLANSTIDRPGGLELLLNTLVPRGSAILWDEFYHGQPRSLWSYAAKTPLPLALVQVSSSLAARVMYKTPFRAGSRAAHPARRPREFVDTRGGLYV